MYRNAEEFKDYKPVILNPNAEDWNDAHNAVEMLEEKFPGQDAWDYVYACYYNEWGPHQEDEIYEFKLIQHGENEEQDWIWEVTYNTYDGFKKYIVSAGCDYTGWDCQSGIGWEPV